MEGIERRESLKPSLVPCTAADIPQLIALEQSISDETYAKSDQPEDWEEIIREGEVYFIQVGEHIAGNFSFQHTAPNTMYINTLVVRPEFRNKGIASDILAGFLIAHAEVRRIYLETHPDGPALKIYQSFGFVEEEFKENHFGDGQHRVILALERK